MQTRTDRELLEDYASSGDEAAFAELASRYGSMVYRTCLRMLGDAHEAEDAAQGTFVVLARKASRLRQEGRLNGWLHRVARNVALQALRRRADRERQREGAALWQETVAELDSRDASARVAAAAALGREGGDKTLALLEKAVADPDASVRNGAALALEHMGGDTVRDLLLRQLSTEKERSVVAAIRNALEVGFPGDPAVEKALKDSQAPELQKPEDRSQREPAPSQAQPAVWWNRVQPQADANSTASQGIDFKAVTLC